jgi:alanine racemase
MYSLSWIELDASAPDHNLREIGKCAADGILLCAVVKANAYGHGIDRMVKLLPSADWFAVNSLDEGLQIRRLGERRPVLVMGHVPLGRLEEAVEADLRLTIFNLQTIEKLSRVCCSEKQVRLHLKIETGTGRQGILIDEIPSFIAELHAVEGIILEGVSTHYANIEDTLNHEYTDSQLFHFNRAVRILNEQGENPAIIHTASTAATILFPRTHFHLLRIGIGIYGLWPSRETFVSAKMGSEKMPDLKPVLTWKTRIVQIKTIPEGSFIGYGCTYRTTRNTTMAVLPVGYADGYDRSLGNKAHVLANGKRAAVIGRVCMNHTMIDVTDIDGLSLEDEVVLLGSSGNEVITAETMAAWAGTINYEIVSRISPLLERRVL